MSQVGYILNYEQLHDIARRALKSQTRVGLARVLRNAVQRYRLRTWNPGSWGHTFKKAADALIDQTETHGIFQLRGNKKLPFATFSTLPGYTCPGAGECLNWCYSFRAWRFPGGFMRQLLNTWFLRHESWVISRAWLALPKGITVRLYVDGDIENVDTLHFWFGLLALRPDLDVYGYSKSWKIFAAWGGDWPDNYTLNISEGSRYDRDLALRKQIRDLPITRGDFVITQVTGKYPPGFKRYDSADYHREVRSSAREQHGKVFSCPGNCGKCRSGRHACGDREFPVTIAIGVH